MRDRGVKWAGPNHVWQLRIRRDIATAEVPTEDREDLAPYQTP